MKKNFLTRLSAKKCSRGLRKCVVLGRTVFLAPSHRARRMRPVRLGGRVNPSTEVELVSLFPTAAATLSPQG